MILNTFITTAQAQSQEGKVLWTYELQGEDRSDYYRHGCATTKRRPFNVEICFTENIRNSFKEAIQGHVQVYLNGRIEKFQIIGVSKAEFLYKTNEYSSNTSFYKRFITLRDHYGRQSNIIEVFSPLLVHGSKIIRSSRVSGPLPNGEVLPFLENFYVHPTYIKNYYQN